MANHLAIMAVMEVAGMVVGEAVRIAVEEAPGMVVVMKAKEALIMVVVEVDREAPEKDVVRATKEALEMAVAGGTTGTTKSSEVWLLPFVSWLCPQKTHSESQH